MRKLASIQKVVGLFPIVGADVIEEAQVQGWRVIVKKGEFQVGDEGLFLEVDSMCPEGAPWCSFLKSRRIKTMKMRGVLSQGLMLPISVVFPDAYRYDDGTWNFSPATGFGTFDEGQDVTELLGVTKYDPEEHGGHIKGINPNKEADFPSHLVPKTDEERVQSAPKLLNALQGQPYVITVKYDGSSATFVYDGDDFRVCSRNMAVKFNEEAPDNYWKMAVKYNLREKLKGTTIALQGELCGPGIQKNRLQLEEYDLFIFSGYDWAKGKYLSHDELDDFCETHNLQQVIVEEMGMYFEYTQEQLLEKAKGVYFTTNNRREGLVIRSLTARQERISFKAINNDFLLKDEE